MGQVLEQVFEQTASPFHTDNALIKSNDFSVDNNRLTFNTAISRLTA
jgi:hypothetical protein